MPTCDWMGDNLDNMTAPQWGIRRGWGAPWANVPPPLHRFTTPPPNINHPPPLINPGNWNVGVPSPPRPNNFITPPNAFQYRPNTRFSAQQLRNRRTTRLSRSHRHGHYRYPDSDDSSDDDSRHNHRNNNHSHHHTHNNNSSNNNNINEDDEQCFLCGDILKNCNESRVHMCSGRVSSDNEDILSEPEFEDSNMEVRHGEHKKMEEDDEIMDNQSPCTSAMAMERDVIEDMKITLKQEKGQVTALRIEANDLMESLRTKEKSLTKWDKELKDKEKKMEQTHDANKAEVKRLEQQLKDECVRMEEQQTVQKGRVKLDIGGNVFTTSTSTLSIDPNSMLAVMFSGRHEIIKQTDETVFIDRDGTHFRHILNYLRDGPASLDTLPRPRQTLKELRNEAAFYQLPGLVQQIETLLN